MSLVFIKGGHPRSRRNYKPIPIGSPTPRKIKSLLHVGVEFAKGVEVKEQSSDAVGKPKEYCSSPTCLTSDVQKLGGHL